MESHVEVQYFRGGNPVGPPIIVNSVSEHPDITDFDFADYVTWAKDAFEIAKDIYGAWNPPAGTTTTKSFFNWFGVIGDIGTALKDVFHGKNRAAKSVGRLMLLAPGAMPWEGPAVDEARIKFQASSEDDLTTSFGSVTPEGKLIDLGEIRYDRNEIHFYEKSYRIPLRDTPRGPYFFSFGSGDEGREFNIGVASFLTVGIAQHRHSGFLIQSSIGNLGDLKLLAPNPTGGLMYYWRRLDDPGWNGPFNFAADLGAVDAVSLIQSTFGAAGAGNIEAVARIGTQLYHFWQTHGDPPEQWSRTMIASGDFSGNPALLQSSFGIKGHFELVVPRAASGLFYFRRDNDPGAHLAWRGPFEFATDTGQIESVCLIQSNFGQPGVGQLEVVVRIGNALAHFIRLTDESPYVWSGPHFFAEGVTGIPALIQGTFGARGNYELVVPRRDAGLAHYFRNNDPVQNLTWYHTADFGLGLGRVDLSSLVQTNWGAGSLFVVARHRRQGPGPRSRKVRSRRAAGDDTIAGVEDFVYFERIDLPPHAWSGPHSFLSHLTVQVMPFPVAIGRSVRVTVTARDAVNRAPVDGAEVLIDDDPTDTVGPVVIGQTNVPFRHTFQAITVRTFNPESRRWETDTIYPVGSVRAPGYVEAPIDWGFPP